VALLVWTRGEEQVARAAARIRFRAQPLAVTGAPTSLVLVVHEDRQTARAMVLGALKALKRTKQ